jgi:putative membrane protein
MKKMLSLTAALLIAAAPAALAQSSTTTNPDATGSGATEMPAATMEKVDTASFFKMVASSNEFEIQSSQLAEKSNASDETKKFAAQMVADHTKAGQEFKAALEKVDQTAATAAPALQPKEQKALDALKAASADAFEEQYIAAQVMAHDEAVALFSNYAQNGDDPALKEFAKKTLPTLEMHQEHVKELAADK